MAGALVADQTSSFCPECFTARNPTCLNAGIAIAPDKYSTFMMPVIFDN